MQTQSKNWRDLQSDYFFKQGKCGDSHPITAEKEWAKLNSWYAEAP
jgi:hypothetical protein